MSPDGQYVSYEVMSNTKIINLENNEVFNPPGASYLELGTSVMKILNNYPTDVAFYGHGMIMKV